MAASGDFAKLERLSAGLRSFGERNSPMQQRLLTPVKQEIKGVLKVQFAKGVDPAGKSWQETVRGRAAMISRKLPFAFDFAVRDGAVVGVGKSTRELLDTLSEGRTFRARQVAAQQQFLTFKKGKMIRNARALNKKGEVKRGVHQTFARAHTVGERVLPPRQVVPQGSDLSTAPLWDAAVARGITAGMTSWHEGLK